MEQQATMLILLLVAIATKTSNYAEGKTISAAEKHFPNVRHDALRLRELSDGEHFVSYHDVERNVHVDYVAETNENLVSMLHETGVLRMTCYEREDDASVSISATFDSRASMVKTKTKMSLGTLVSATCAIDGEYHPIYASLKSARPVGERELELVVERVHLRELFKHLSASISVAPHETKSRSKPQQRRLRGEDEIHWKEGDLNENDASRLGLGEAIYTSNSQPMQVESNWESMDETTQEQVSGADIDKNYQIFEGFGFNYDAATESAAVSPLLFANGVVKCNNCHAHIDAAFVNVEMKFGTLGGPEHVAAWVEGGMGANLEMEVLSPALAIDETFQIQQKTQVYTFEFAIGPIPVRWVVYSELLAEVKLDRAIPEGALAARGGLHADINLKAGVEWTKANGWGQIDDIDFDYGMYPVAVITPDLSTQNTIQAKLIPTITLSLFDAIPFMIRPIPTLGYDFGGDVNQCAKNDGYSQFTSFHLGLGVGDVKLPDENGVTILSGFSREFTVYGKTYTSDDELFGDAVCGPKDETNFCSGCLSDLNADKDALIDLFKSVCQSLEGGCDSEQLERSAEMYGLSSEDVRSIQESDDGMSTTTIGIIAAACVVVACVAAFGIVRMRRQRARANVRTIHVSHNVTKKRTKKGTKRNKRKNNKVKSPTRVFEQV